MSSKAGYLKTEKAVAARSGLHSKNFATQIGEVLQKMGQTGYDFMNTGAVQTGAGAVGKVVGSALIPIPFVGGAIGKAAGKALANNLKYNFGTVGEIGKSIQDLQNGSSVGQEIVDVLTYAPRQFINELKDGDMMKVIRGEMNWRDAAVNALEDFTGVNWMTGKTHAWKDKQGNYHKEYVDGAKMVVGEWKEQPNTQPRPDINSNAGILGVYQGEVFRRGFDDARWAQLQRQGKVK